MAAKSTEMELVKQVLNLYNEGKSIKGIVRITGVSRNTVKGYINRGAAVACDPKIHSDADLAKVLYNQDTAHLKSIRYQQLLAQFDGIEKELVKPGVTKQILWREYIELHPDGYGQSQYYYHLQKVLKNKDVVMHLEYTPAEQIMVDFAGKKYHYVDLQTGERMSCEVFVATLPYSGLLFCIAVPSQKTASFLHACNQMLKYVGGATQTILCDNLRTAVTKSDKYEPTFTDLCYHLSEHYATTFSAARPGKPRDKAMVEKAVSIIYQNIYAPLRKQVFKSIAEVNHHFRIRLDKVNVQSYKGSAFSRRDLFEQQERALLRELPAAPCLLKHGTTITVQRNYHIQLREDGLYYSVPWQYVGKKVKVWYDQKTVEVYYDHERIAIHPRSHQGQGYTTLGDHMPLNHQQAMAIKGWSREGLLAKATRVGPSTAEVATKILSNSIYMEQNYKACFGMLTFEGKYGAGRLEAACHLALSGMRVNYTMIKNILHTGMDKQIRLPVEKPLPSHDNIRGPQHYL
jgi:transposase